MLNSGWLIRLRRGFRRGPHRTSREILIELAPRIGVPSALGKIQHLEHTHAPVECDRHDVAPVHAAACGIDALAVDADMAGARKRGGGAAGAHHPRVPQPFIDTLPVQGLAGFLVRFELGLERGQLRKR